MCKLFNLRFHEKLSLKNNFGQFTDIRKLQNNIIIPNFIKINFSKNEKILV